MVESVNLSQVEPGVLNGYFANPAKWNLTLPQAKDATRFFVALASEAGIALSPHLSALVRTERATRDSRPKKDIIVVQKTTQKGPSSVPFENLNSNSSTKTEHKANIQATITMSLDKDTPIQIWKMAMKLLGSDERDDPKESN